ncbi:hypothetical protein V8C86DRAFT_2903040, partial [Haematococcus lacustris]
MTRGGQAGQTHQQHLHLPWLLAAGVLLPQYGCLSCSLHLLAASPPSYDSWLCFVAAFHGCLLAPGCCFWLH